MKRLIAVIMFLGFLTLPLSANAGPCEYWWNELVNQCFVTTVDETEFTACFSDSYFGPCPGGTCTVEYVDIQYIDGIPYKSLISIDFVYLTDANYVTIEGLDFILTDGRLILMPENPLIFNQVD